MQAWHAGDIQRIFEWVNKYLIKWNTLSTVSFWSLLSWPQDSVTKGELIKFSHCHSLCPEREGVPLRNFLHPRWYLKGFSISAYLVKFLSLVLAFLASWETLLIPMSFWKGTLCFTEHSKPECPRRYWKRAQAPGGQSVVKAACWPSLLFLFATACFMLSLGWGPVCCSWSLLIQCFRVS